MAVPRTVCALWNCPLGRCVQCWRLKAPHPALCPLLVSPRAEPRAGRGRMWNVEAQGVSEALWKSGGRKISSVKGAREREPSSSKEDLARKAQMT